MRMPRVRFTIRRMMIAVAVMALMAWLGILGARHWRYRSLAASYAAKELLAESFTGGDYSAGGVDVSTATQFPTRPGEKPVTAVMTNLDYYATMRAKYESAARFPWLPVSPDPPEPE